MKTGSELDWPMPVVYPDLYTGTIYPLEVTVVERRDLKNLRVAETMLGVHQILFHFSPKHRRTTFPSFLCTKVCLVTSSGQ